MSYRNYSVANSRTVCPSGNCDFTTIGAAITAAGAGPAEIFIRPGTYTENLTLPANINLTAFGADASPNGTGLVIISGTITKTSAGSSTISGIQLQTNSAALLAVTGTLASVVNLNNCYLNCTNNTGITFSSSSASAQININNCFGDIGTTGIGIYSMSSIGTLNTFFTQITNTGASTTATTNSAGKCNHRYSKFFSPFSCSSTGTCDFVFTNIVSNAANSTCFTTAGSGISGIANCELFSGTASAISVGTGTSINLYNSLIDSSNTNALTGLGTLISIGNVFTNTSHLSNVTTQTGGAASGLTQGTAPSAGFLGENIRASASSVALVTLTPKTICSISLTAGIWDISAISTTVCATSGNYSIMGISTATNALTGTVEGDNQTTLALATGTFSNIPNVIPAWRVTISATTSYFLVVSASFAGTAAASSRLSATRVG